MLKKRIKPFTRMLEELRADGCYTYFRAVSECNGPEVVVGGRRLVMVSSNDYLGLSVDPRVVQAASDATRKYGTGPGGSRFLCGNMSLHEELESELSDFVGKKGSIVHTTGFLANHGALGCLAESGDTLLFDKESHASLFEGGRVSSARVTTFKHNDVQSAEAKLSRIHEKNGAGCTFIVSEGVFSMSGDVAALDDLVALKKKVPNSLLYLDDAHGLGVMGPGGRGTASHFGALQDVDIVMGTFSKAFASIGGFIASDDLCLLDYLKHQSRTLIFSAALPAASAAAALQSLRIIRQEPERVQKLWDNAKIARKGYLELGLNTGDHESPIVPIRVGDEVLAYEFSEALFREGVFALPAVYPAVPRGEAIIRTAYMSTHTAEHIENVLEVLERVGRKYGLVK